MQIYIGIDDTDVTGSPMGTGKLVRRLAQEALPSSFQLIGIVRHQLPKLPTIPYTSNNSSACAIVSCSTPGDIRRCIASLAQEVAIFVKSHAPEGSDPGVCVVPADAVSPCTVEFGNRTAGVRVSQQEAMQCARNMGAVLLGLGGSNDGIIGATAGVGLTKGGWCGRFIEYGRLRQLQDPLTIRDVLEVGIQVVSVDRDPRPPHPAEHLADACWLRPSLWGGQPVLQVTLCEDGAWRTAHGKRKKTQDSSH